jgi:gluconolactonase
MLRVSLCGIVLGTLLLVPLSPAAADDLSELVRGEVEKVVGDCKFTEGPAWHPDGYLLFSDIPNSRIIRFNPDGTHDDWMKPSGGANGLMCDKEGHVYACQGDLQQVARLASGTDVKGALAAVLAKEYDGKPLNKPNDLALDADGGLYFTDPNYRQQPPSQPVQGVYYIAKDGVVKRVIGDLPRPNGVLVSPDGKTLYVANIERRQIMAYPIVAPGQLSDGKAIFTGDEQIDGNGPDGMALDSDGRIYATYKQIVVVNPKGDLIGRVEVPEKPANCAFGGVDNKTLYITARTSLYMLPMKVKGMDLQEHGPHGVDVATASAESPVGESGCDDAPAKEGAAKAEETATVELDGLKLTVPKSWEKQQPTSRLRLGQFAIPAKAGDDEGAEYVVFPPFGGTAQQNIERWIGQFEGQGREVKATQGTAEQGKYVFVELTGTYKKPFGPPFAQQTKPAPDYKMLGVILTAEAGGNYFIKVTGPKGTVADVADEVRKSFGGSAEKETKYELE